MCRKFICLISFAVLLIAANSVQAFTTVTTAVGNGADTWVCNGSSERSTVTNGTATELRARYIGGGTRCSITYLRFDISDVGGDMAMMAGATLSMTESWAKGSARTLEVYGLVDETLDSWVENTTCYANAPGMLTPSQGNDLGYYAIDTTKLTLLGNITVPAAPAGTPSGGGIVNVVFSSNDVNLPLTNFLNTDTNKRVTLVIINARGTSSNNSEDRFASKEHANTSLMRPTLTFPNAFPLRAYNPNPATGSIVTSTTSVLLQWQRGAYAAQHDIYFGSNWTDVNNATSSSPMGPDKVYKARQSVDANSYNATGLSMGVTYYWRIDEVNNNAGAPAGSPWKGTIWSFRILPTIAWDPTPPDGASPVAPRITLRWLAGSGAVSGHKVYLDTTDPPTTLRATLTPTAYPTWTPGTGILNEYNKTYFWRVDEYNGVTTYPGSVWRFTTVPTAPPEPSLLGWWRFDENANDSSGHWYNGTASSDLSPPIPPAYIDDLQLYTGGREISLAGNDYKQYVDLPIGTLISSLTNSTFAMWVNVRAGSSTVRWQKFFDFGTSTTNYVSLRPRESSSPPTHFQITTGGVTNRVGWGTNTGGTPGGSTLPLNEWHHLAVTISEPNDDDLRTYTLYVDGTQVGINTQCTLTPSDVGVTTSNWLGKSIDLTIGGLYIVSYLDDFRIYDRELSRAEIVKMASPSVAWRPSPADGATDVEPTPTLKWNPGSQAAKHDVYFSDNWDAVNDANSLDPNGPDKVYKGRQDPNKYDITTLLELEKTYYWRIDEVNDSNIWPGSIWSFTTGNYLVVDDFEDYTNSDPNIIYKIWKDGVGYSPGNGTGSQAGYRDPNYAEMTIVHGGRQSMPFDYNNTKSPYDSNASRTFATDQNWTALDVKALSLWLRGYPALVGSFVESPAGTYTMTASGTDIWNVPDLRRPSRFHDEFHYAYMGVSGDCEIKVKVDSISNTDAFAKAGVMIRNSTDANSAEAIVCITPGNGVRFSYRAVAGGATITDNNVPGITAPCWLWLKRTLNEYTNDYELFAGYSTCGPTGEPNNWQQFGGPITITKTDPVCIGLALTAHNAEATCTAVFSNVSGVTPPSPWLSHQDIGIKSNTAAPLYVTLQDSSTPAKTATVTHSDPNIVLQNTWQAWDIALSDFTGVDLTKVKKITIGLGNRIAHQGAGTLYFDDIRLYIPRCVLLKRSADFAKADYIPAAGDCVVDYQELGTMLNNNWLRGTPSAAEEIWREAEDANTMGPLMQVYSDRADASGGEYIAVVPGTPSAPNTPNLNGVATYNFTVNGGTYKVLGRVVAPSGTTDSLWCRIPGATTQITPPNPNGWIFWDVSEAGNNWAWDELNSDPNGDATVQFTMSAGTYTLEIAYRERTLLDRLLITDDLGLNQATLPPWDADLNGDNRIDIKDFALLAKQWLIEQLWP